MAEETQRIIERYLGLVQPERKEDVDQAELEAIARELGVTEDEIRAGEAAASDHATRGRLHSAHGLHDDAVRELGAALALRPFDREIRRGLAEVLVARFEANNEPQDASRSEPSPSRSSTPRPTIKRPTPSSSALSAQVAKRAHSAHGAPSWWD